MNVFFENTNLHSTSGPNSFARKLRKYLLESGHEQSNDIAESDIRLCFIESFLGKQSIPTVQRLDGIYFNIDQNYNFQNSNIKNTYKISDGVVFQSYFNKDLIFKYFGAHEKYSIIHNGADIDLIDSTPPLDDENILEFDDVWCCASSWRPHKRLSENVLYFLEHSGKNDCLIVAGQPDSDVRYDPRIFYVGNLTQEQLISVYKISKYFIHLAWLDHCPNVVVDARASGCQIICSSAGGTKEIAGPDAIVIEEDEWDFNPVRLYHPPPLNFSNKIKISTDSDYNMMSVSQRYVKFLQEFIE
jgi:glycosyltransferase involved in cell wall biosynthesis